MAIGPDAVNWLLIAAGILLGFLLLDILVAGGGMTGGMMGGMGSMMGGLSGMMGTPWGWIFLLLVLGAIALTLFGPSLGLSR